MTTRMEIYRCELCGNIVEVVTAGAGTLVCCGQKMTVQTENTVDAATEKHVPVAELAAAGLTVKVGSVDHPMTDEHFIEWVQLIDPQGVHSPRHYLKAGDEPHTVFKMPVQKGWMVRAYCNLHGLWTSEV